MNLNQDETTIAIGVTAAGFLLLAYVWIIPLETPAAPTITPIGEEIEKPATFEDNAPTSPSPNEPQIPIAESVEIHEVQEIHDTPSSDPPIVQSVVTSRRGGGGGGGEANDVDKDPEGIKVMLHVIPNPVPSPGLAVSVYGISLSTPAVSGTTFELYGPECPLVEEIPCATETDLSETSPTLVLTAEELALCDDNCEEYAITFNGDLFTQAGNYQVIAKFQDSDGNVVVIEEQMIIVQSFLVIPESPIGIIAVVASTLAALAAFLSIKKRSHRKGRSPSLSKLGI
jgi:hypothetical protein